MLKGVNTEPDSTEFLYVLARFYPNSGRPGKARPVAEKMVKLTLNQRIGHDLLAHIDRRLKGGTR